MLGNLLLRTPLAGRAISSGTAMRAVSIAQLRTSRHFVVAAALHGIPCQSPRSVTSLEVVSSLRNFPFGPVPWRLGHRISSDHSFPHGWKWYIRRFENGKQRQKICRLSKLSPAETYFCQFAESRINCSAEDRDAVMINLGGRK